MFDSGTDCGSITVGIIDDQQIVRLGLEQLFSRSRKFVVAISVATVDRFVERAIAPHVVLVELYLGGDHPMFRAITQVAARSRVLTMCNRFRRADAIGALRAGANGIVPKQARAEDFVKGVTTIAGGGAYLPPQLAGAETSQGPQRPDCLSPREQEALSHVAQGLTHSQAAARMGVTVSTFNTHIRRVREKLGIGNKAHLTRTALEFGLTV